VLIAGAATVGALFGTPVAAALLFTGIVAAAKGGGSLWDRLFLPVAAAGCRRDHRCTCSGLRRWHSTSRRTAVRRRSTSSPAHSSRAGGRISLAALVAFPIVWAGACTPCATRSSSRSSAGFLLGILGLIGGPITMFKGLEQIGELLQDPSAYDGTQLAVIAGIKILALLVAAGSLFRGAASSRPPSSGSLWACSAMCSSPAFRSGWPCACGIVGVVLVIGRDGWLAIFLGVAIPADITLLPMLCVIVLPAWLLVSRAPEFRIVPRPPTRLPRPPPTPTPSTPDETAGR
jgi:hypothetical protein